MPSLNDIRRTFLDYFARNGHEIVPSSSLVPRNDPTLMFTAAGMVQFKNLFTGVEKRDYQRATTAQKCVRAGGKHNDLDNVGYTARHHTFFEMLGNFSFGDYFKEEAIPLAWGLLTREFGIDPDRLLVTVYHTDEEAVEIWKRTAGLPDERIIRIANDDNFWSAGPTGPCGPCTEIFYDHGPHIPGGPPGSADEDGDRFIEIWNLVFMEFEQFADGTRRDLDAKSIDTGMGLERIGALLQDKHDNYDTDLLRALIEASAAATGTDPDGPGNVHHRVIADHLRSSSFLIADGVLPSNEGRGYVLRRIMRRAMRHAHLLGAADPVMYRLVPDLTRQMGHAYPELVEAQRMIEETMLSEETRFRRTLERGLKMLDEEVARLPEGADLPGETAFRLYDTYGFPLDLTQDALREKGRGINTEGFTSAMSAQKAQARASWVGSGEMADAAIWFDIADRHGVTEFLGYEDLRAEGEVLALVTGTERVTEAGEGQEVQVVLNQTPFYAEAGGQVGDSGTIETDGATVTVSDTRKVAGVFIHVGTVTRGILAEGATARLSVDAERRRKIRANHSATHLLNEALREELGPHVAQRGSLNDADRLRFDFSHPKALTAAETTGVQRRINQFIRQDSPVETRLMDPDTARELGAQALFGEKYGDEVRVVSMGVADTGRGPGGDTWSIELCGGTHVARTGEIGLWVLTGDSASAAGVRRIEALTGQAALDHLVEGARRSEEAAAILKTTTGDLVERVQAIVEERRRLENEVAQLRRDLAMSGGSSGGAEARDVAGIPFLAQVLTGVTGRDLPALIDAQKGRLGTGAVLLIADAGDKAAVAAGVTDDLTHRVSAIDLVKAAVGELGGKGGGGRPDLAQGGAKDTANTAAAIAAAEIVLRGD